MNVFYCNYKDNIQRIKKIDKIEFKFHLSNDDNISFIRKRSRERIRYIPDIILNAQM